MLRSMLGCWDVGMLGCWDVRFCRSVAVGWLQPAHGRSSRGTLRLLYHSSSPLALLLTSLGQFDESIVVSFACAVKLVRDSASAANCQRWTKWPHKDGRTLTLRPKLSLPVLHRLRRRRSLSSKRSVASTLGMLTRAGRTSSPLVLRLCWSIPEISAVCRLYR